MDVSANVVPRYTKVQPTHELAAALLGLGRHYEAIGLLLRNILEQCEG